MNHFNIYFFKLVYNSVLFVLLASQSDFHISFVIINLSGYES